MNEQIREAIQSRLSMGQTREQIRQEFLYAGYDSEEFDRFFDSLTNNNVSAVPTKSKQGLWKPVLITGSLFLLALLSVSGYFLYSQHINEIPQETNTFETVETATTTPDIATTTVVVPMDSEQSDIAQVVEEEANKLSAKFTNDSGEGISGLYEAYVEGVKFIEASSTPALVAMKNCLLNIYQNPSYSFTCYVNEIQGVESTPQVTEKSPYLFLSGPTVKHRLIWIAEEQLPTATNITYNSEGTETNSTLFIPEEYREEALGFIEESEISTRHDGRHFLGGYPKQEPSAHMVAYIDLDDPFSKHFYPTILELRELYTSQELVIEVQHLPLTQLHPNAGNLASAAHCAAEQGDKYYWLFIRSIFDDRDGNSAYEMSNLPQLVKNIGLNDDDFRTCVESGTYDSVITQQAQAIVTTGAMGTPHTIIFNRITGVSEPEIIEGAQPLSELTSAIDSILES